MLSEEMLVEIKGFDAETSLGEIIGMINEYSGEHAGAVKYEWELIADIAFLAHIHKKPRGFKIIMDFMMQLLLFCHCQQGFDRTAVLLAHDAPEDPEIVTYMLGRVKESLTVAQAKWKRMKKKDKKHIADWMANVLPGLKLTPGEAIYPD
jgi:hypothetical protein